MPSRRLLVVMLVAATVLSACGGDHSVRGDGAPPAVPRDGADDAQGVEAALDERAGGWTTPPTADELRERYRPVVDAVAAGTVYSDIGDVDAVDAGDGLVLRTTLVAGNDAGLSLSVHPRVDGGVVGELPGGWPVDPQDHAVRDVAQVELGGVQATTLELRATVQQAGAVGEARVDVGDAVVVLSTFLFDHDLHPDDEAAKVFREAVAALRPFLDADEGPIWFDVLGVSQEAPGTGLLELAADAPSLRDGWGRFGLDGNVPDVDLDRRVVLFVGRAEDACPDELVAVTRTAARLTFTWVPPSGGCDTPLIPTSYAVALHRADLGAAPTVELVDLGGHVEATFELAAYDGPPAPEPPTVVQPASAAELAAVVEASPLDACADVDDPARRPVEVDGPLADDADVAAAQERRAEVGLPSDEATVRDLLADPANLERGFDLPLTQDEFDEIFARQDTGAIERLTAYGVDDHPETYGFSFFDQASGGRLVLGFTDDLEGHRERIAERFPDAAVDVVAAPTAERERRAVMEQLTELRDELPGMEGWGLGVARVEIGFVEPTSEDLDRLADGVNPSFVCVNAYGSGPTLEGDG